MPSTVIINGDSWDKFFASMTGKVPAAYGMAGAAGGAPDTSEGRVMNRITLYVDKALRDLGLSSQDKDKLLSMARTAGHLDIFGNPAGGNSQELNNMAYLLSKTEGGSKLTNNQRQKLSMLMAGIGATDVFGNITQSAQWDYVVRQLTKGRNAFGDAFAIGVDAPGWGQNMNEEQLIAGLDATLGTNRSGDTWTFTPTESTDTGAGTTAEAAEAAPVENVDPILAALHSEYLKLSGSPAGDPTYQGLVAAGMSAGRYAAHNQGVAGNEGLGLRNMATAATQAAAPYLQQRAGLAQQALSLSNSRDLGLSQLELGQNQLNMEAQQIQNANSLASWQYAQQQGQGLGGAIGAAIGSLGYAIPYVGTAVGPVTSKVGQSLGAYFGGTSAGNAPSMGSYTPKYGGYSGGW